MNASVRLDDIQISTYARTLQNGEFIVIGDIIKKGLWIRIPVVHYNYILAYIGIVDGYKKLMDALDSPEKQDYYTYLLEALAEIKVLERKDQIQNSCLVKDLTLELTTTCNLRCKHCAGMYGSKKAVNLSDARFKHIVKWAADNGIQSLTLTGGEIFCIPDIYEKLEYIRNNFNGSVGIITNATLFSAEKIHVIKECIDVINISLDGYDEKSVDFVRGKGVFRKVVDSISMLHDNGFSDITLSMVLTSDNKRHIDDFKQLCAKLKVKPITRFFAIKGRALENYDLLIWDQDKGQEDQILKHINMLSTCNAGVTTLSIDSNGLVTLCPATEDSKISLGCSDELDDILKNISHMQQTCVVDEISPCKFCNVRYFCSSRCYATNINIFTNPSLRKQRCHQYKEILEKHIWG